MVPQLAVNRANLHTRPTTTLHSHLHQHSLRDGACGCQSHKGFSLPARAPVTTSTTWLKALGLWPHPPWLSLWHSDSLRCGLVPPEHVENKNWPAATRGGIPLKGTSQSYIPSPPVAVLFYFMFTFSFISNSHMTSVYIYGVQYDVLNTCIHGV
jgi:hypothetical protein